MLFDLKTFETKTSKTTYRSFPLSISWVIIDLDYGLALNRRQAISLINTDMSLNLLIES